MFKKVLTFSNCRMMNRTRQEKIIINIQTCRKCGLPDWKLVSGFCFGYPDEGSNSVHLLQLNISVFCIDCHTLYSLWFFLSLTKTLVTLDTEGTTASGQACQSRNPVSQALWVFCLMSLQLPIKQPGFKSPVSALNIWTERLSQSLTLINEVVIPEVTILWPCLTN